MITVKKARCPQQVDEYQFTNPVPVQMRGVVMAELAAVRIRTFVLDVKLCGRPLLKNNSSFQIPNLVLENLRSSITVFVFMKVDISWKILTLARPSHQACII